MVITRSEITLITHPASKLQGIKNMKFQGFRVISLLSLCALLLSACVQTVPKDALTFTPESLKNRQLQTKRFETGQEKKLLTASAQVLQDMGFTIEESETKLGTIVGSKDADATNAGQIAGAILIAALGGGSVPIDDKQKIRVSVVTKPSSGKTTNLRVTFQRIVWNNYGQVSKLEFVNDEEIYKDFFDKLSKSVFLTANEI